MKHGIVYHAAHPLGLAMDAGDGCAGEVALHRKAPEGDNQPGVNQRDLLVEVGPAGLDLWWLGIAVPWRPAFDDIGDIHILPFEVDLGQEFVQIVARRADKGYALAVFVKAGTFADEHDIGVLWTLAWHGVGPSLTKDALLAGLNLIVEISEFGQCMAPFVDCVLILPQVWVFV